MMHMISKAKEDDTHVSGFESIMLKFKESHQPRLSNGSRPPSNWLKCIDGGYGNQCSLSWMGTRVVPKLRVLGLILNLINRIGR